LLHDAADPAASVAALVPVADEEEALQRIARSPYRLGVAVFGSPARARALARRVDAGVVVVNDMIVPTADPRVPFGGRGKSGFGVTRGAEGLLEMTTTRTVIVRAGKFRPHFEAVGERDAPLFAALVQALHGSSLGRRWRGLGRLMREGRARRSRQSHRRRPEREGQG
jgi:delta 1-pyrroline-5-carboxylate dehydrogenase